METKPEIMARTRFSGQTYVLSTSFNYQPQVASTVLLPCVIDALNHGLNTLGAAPFWLIHGPYVRRYTQAPHGPLTVFPLPDNGGRLLVMKAATPAHLLQLLAQFHHPQQSLKTVYLATSQPTELPALFSSQAKWEADMDMVFSTDAERLRRQQEAV
jgi:hypothetical protein